MNKNASLVEEGKEYTGRIIIIKIHCEKKKVPSCSSP